MQLGTLHHNLVEPAATIFRLLTVALAALAFALSGQPIDMRLIPIGVAYMVAAGPLWLFAPRLGWTWVVYPMALLDVGVVTAIISLAPESSPALWSLYLFPLASTAAAGPVPALVAAGLSVISYLSAIWFTTGTVSALAVWQIIVLMAATALITILTHRWMAERHEKRAWQEVTAAARGLVGSDEPDRIAATIAERARRLVRADRAWIWWCDRDGRLRPAAQAGKPSGEPIECGELIPNLMNKLDRGTVPLDELGGSFAALIGDAVLLRGETAGIALIGVSWSKPPRDRAGRCRQLRVFAPWATDALARAQEIVARSEELRRGSVLEDAACDLACTLERRTAREIIVDAAREGLTAAISLVERSSGRVIMGDEEVTEALVRQAVEGGVNEADSNTPASSEREWNASLSIPIEENLALIAWRDEPRMNALDAAWLDQLAEVGRVALERCGDHEHLQANERRLRESLEALPSPMAIWDASGALIFANIAYLALGQGDMPKGVQSPNVHEEEVVLGSPPRVYVAVTMQVSDGKYVVSHLHEITREREALRAKDELIRMVGHELRTPLTSIHGYSQMMSRQLGVVQQQVDQLNRLIGDFVEASKVEGGRLPLSREVVNLAQLARMAAERFRGAYNGRGLQLELSNPPPIEGDPVRLGQVLDNLLSNAVKYSPPDQEIVLTVGMEAGQVVLSVRDHGVGISREHLPLLFDRFYRVQNADTEHVKGSGLGLSIVRDIVTAHGGRVWAESDGLGLGSTFRVSLSPIESGGETLRLEARRAS